ncbi:MAG: hypothetical protein QOJ32_1931 [Frankiaceae bacterium]|nr:hypothetical protein [Frankiaceae bacterium]
MDLHRLALEERLEFADLLQALRPAEWDAESLCVGWQVRDVVAHVISYDELDVRSVGKELLAARFSPDRLNGIRLQRFANLPPDELLAAFRARTEPRGLPAGFGGAIGLTDALIHQQDVRRPLGLPRKIPPERLRAALWTAYTAPVVRGFWHTRGLRMVATDVDWSFGLGPEVRGPGEAVLMAVAGRRGVAGELSGPGQPRLTARLG